MDIQEYQIRVAAIKAKSADFAKRHAENKISLPSSAFRLAKAVMKGETITATTEEIGRRLAICRKCEFFHPAPMRCQKCNCFLNLKTRLETEHCPIAKW
jgi:hypothetical protein